MVWAPQKLLSFFRFSSEKGPGVCIRPGCSECFLLHPGLKVKGGGFFCFQLLRKTGIVRLDFEEVSALLLGSWCVKSEINHFTTTVVQQVVAKSENCKQGS